MKERHSKSYHLHLVSDATGETLEAIVSAALVQFEGVNVQKHFWPLIRSALQMDRLMGDILDAPGLVLYTLVNPEIRDVLEQRCLEENIPSLSILDPVINLLGSYFNQKASHEPGRQHMMDAHYFQRIDALHFTMAHDDGQLAMDLPQADIVLVGVSRSSKTPTSIYLANKGLKTANVPFVPNCPMPAELDHMEGKFVVGLTTSPDRLVQIRTNRLRSINQDESGDYTDLDLIQDEVKQCRRYCAERGWSTIDVTRRSIEETAAAVLNKYNTWLNENGKTARLPVDLQ
ncbi:putative pyruvate, phosphate dikinase regulatory protein [Kordiimonas sediminis]|uniref:Putative pyruvate, phosphate dikinase regulatory protein n=1 Tax=Kordiimonas sediminis TaxID=1735581 RepID=A0A919AMU2_9PROT|nr:pyruvate, water dikinase regulatory protein [Kordiimonas sediminis]GHF15496.1 putative pyruvate, phosphate dikinase regulatory protein [Kordiimonas sediminis]